MALPTNINNDSESTEIKHQSEETHIHEEIDVIIENIEINELEIEGNSENEEFEKAANIYQNLLSDIFGKNIWSKFLSSLLANILVFVTALGGIIEFAPPRLDFLNDTILPITIFVAIIVTIIPFVRMKDKNEEFLNTSKALGNSIKVTAYGLIVFLILYIISFIVTLPNYATINEVRKELLAYNLHEGQLDDIANRLLDNDGFVNEEYLMNIGINEDTIPDILAKLEELDNTYVRIDEFPNLFETQYHIQETKVALLTQLAEPVSCYLIGDKHSSINIRTSPEVPSNDPSANITEKYLLRDAIAHVLGHNGEILEYKWWYVEVVYKGDEVEGWVSANEVSELDPDACGQVLTIATPVP
jgi:hypothetical protein